MAEVLDRVDDPELPARTVHTLASPTAGDFACARRSQDAGAASPPLPNRPVLDWRYLRRPDRARAAPAEAVDSVPHRLGTTSGRAALYQALRLLKAQPGARVLVPTYHCPSMVAPIVRAGLEPSFFAIGGDGLPLLQSIGLGGTQRPVAMIVPHYFGLARSLAQVRAWCDANAVVLIEDCAHAFFGRAGERPVGQWGDYAIASLTKFFPLPEAGLLVSTTRPLARLCRAAPTWRAQVQGCVDVLELASRHGRLRGTTTALRALFALKDRLRHGDARARQQRAAAAGASADLAADCDMHRVELRPLWIAELLYRFPDRGRIVAARCANYAAYADALANLPGAKPLAPSLPSGAAPYVFPLVVDDAERVYEALRIAGMPVFRWDRVWPRTPMLDGDVAPFWRHHVLQLLCHQDLDPTDVARVCSTLAAALTKSPNPAPHATASRGS